MLRQVITKSVVHKSEIRKFKPENLLRIDGD